jgi:uncharacterized membrane protein
MKFLFKIWCVLALFLAFSGIVFAETEIVQEKGDVLEIEKIVEEMTEQQILKVELLSGEKEGDVVTIMNDIHGNPLDVEVAEGDKVFLYAQVVDGEIEQYFIQDFWHLDGLIIWSVIFLLLVIVIGGKAGIKAILSLGGSVALIFVGLLPLIKNGYSPVLFTFLFAAVIIVFTHLLITGVSRKSWVAMAGTLGGVLFALLFAYLMGYFAQITGLGTEDSRILAVNYSDLDIRGIFLAGVIFGALGAVMDTAISISSGLSEVKAHKARISRRELIKSGMNIGRDIMGSMLNTLVFAYIGAAMISIVLFYLLQTGVVELLNYGFIAEEFMRSLVGSLGLLMTIPLTAVLSGFIIAKKD